jgi:hypothetical protein
VTTGFELWTSGSDKGCIDGLKWCSKKTNVDTWQVNWAAGQPRATGGCMFVNFSKTSVNDSTFSLADCTEKRNFVCEVDFCFCLAVKPNLNVILNTDFNCSDGE